MGEVGCRVGQRHRFPGISFLFLSLFLCVFSAPPVQLNHLPAPPPACVDKWGATSFAGQAPSLPPLFFSFLCLFPPLQAIESQDSACRVRLRRNSAAHVSDGGGASGSMLMMAEARQHQRDGWARFEGSSGLGGLQLREPRSPFRLFSRSSRFCTLSHATELLFSESCPQQGHVRCGLRRLFGRKSSSIATVRTRPMPILSQREKEQPICM